MTAGLRLADATARRQAAALAAGARLAPLGRFARLPAPLRSPRLSSSSRSYTGPTYMHLVRRIVFVVPAPVMP